MCAHAGRLAPKASQSDRPCVLQLSSTCLQRFAALSTTAHTQMVSPPTRMKSVHFLNSSS